MALKILVCGDARGEFDELFKRVNAVNKKNGPFEMLLCVGDFFGPNRDKWEGYKTNPSKIAVHTYVLGPNRTEHKDYYPNSEGSELCDKVTYLGKSGLYSGGSGLQIAYVSGFENDEGLSSDTNFSPNEIDDLKTGLTDRPRFKGVDILITSQWPKGVTKFAGSLEDNTPNSTASSALAQLALAIKPRYHFCGLEDIYYERLPYRNHKVLAEGARHVTRFIALAAIGNAAKKKWLYAFTITPLSKMENTELIKQPDDVTECPFQFETIVKQVTSPQAVQQYFYDLSSREDSKLKRGRGTHDRPMNKRPKTRLPPLSSCWFCLSSSQVEKHLVVSVGDHNYLALAKGGLVPDHVLILPIGHCQATIGLDDDAVLEIDVFKSTLRKFYKHQGKTVVFFERNYKSFHLQIQVVPLPLNKVEIVKQTFLDIADSQSIVLDEIPSHSDLKQIVNQGAPYFYVELPNGEKLLHRIRKHFPLQFGREVLASPPLLDLPSRVDWKACTTNKEEETHLAQEFRNAFQPYDFTL